MASLAVFLALGAQLLTLALALQEAGNILPASDESTASREGRQLLSCSTDKIVAVPRSDCYSQACSLLQGEYQELPGVQLAGKTIYFHKGYSNLFLYYSDVYAGYWVLCQDFYSSDAGLLDFVFSGAETPVDIQEPWQYSLGYDMTWKCAEAASSPTPSPTSLPKTPSPTSLTPSPTSLTPSPTSLTPSPTSLTPSPTSLPETPSPTNSPETPSSTPSGSGEWKPCAEEYGTCSCKGGLTRYGASWNGEDKWVVHDMKNWDSILCTTCGEDNGSGWEAEQETVYCGRSGFGSNPWEQELWDENRKLTCECILNPPDDHPVRAKGIAAKKAASHQKPADLYPSGCPTNGVGKPSGWTSWSDNKIEFPGTDAAYTQTGKIGWAAASAMCKDRGQRLCTRQEYCPSLDATRDRGAIRWEPLRGGTSSPTMAPVIDKENEWVVVGTADATDKTMCKRYSEVSRDQVASDGHNDAQVLLCCADNGKQPQDGVVAGIQNMDQQCPYVTACQDHAFRTNSAKLQCNEGNLNNKQCDPECNNPACGFDGGDCCSDTNASPENEISKPLVCFDPEHAYKHNTFRIDYDKPKCRTLLKSQGGCGSCYAFAATTAAEYMTCQAGQVAPYGFSPAQSASCLYARSDGQLPSSNGGRNPTGFCHGGWPEDILSFMHSEGLRGHHCFPYRDGPNYLTGNGGLTQYTCQQVYDQQSFQCEASNDYRWKLRRGTQCDSSNNYCNPMRNNGKWFKLVDIDKRTKKEVLAQLKTVGALVAHHTIPFEEYKSNPVEATKTDSSRHGNHATALIGFGEYVQKKAGGGQETKSFWVLQNSYGDANGHDDGKFYIDADIERDRFTGFKFGLYDESYAIPEGQSLVQKLAGSSSDLGDLYWQTDQGWGSKNFDGDRRRHLTSAGFPNRRRHLLETQHEWSPRQREHARKLLEESKANPAGIGFGDTPVVSREMPDSAKELDFLGMAPGGGSSAKNCSSSESQDLVGAIMALLEDLYAGNREQAAQYGLDDSLIAEAKGAIQLEKSKFCKNQVTEYEGHQFTLEIFDGTTLQEINIDFQFDVMGFLGNCTVDINECMQDLSSKINWDELNIDVLRTMIPEEIMEQVERALDDLQSMEPAPADAERDASAVVWNAGPAMPRPSLAAFTLLALIANYAALAFF